MIVDFRDGTRSNYPYDLFDRHGVNISLEVVWCDTGSGEIRYLKTDEHGQFQIDHIAGCVVEETAHFDAPLRVIDAFGKDVVPTENFIHPCG